MAVGYRLFTPYFSFDNPIEPDPPISDAPSTSQSLVESLLLRVQSWVHFLLQVVRGTDRETGTAFFIVGYLVFCAIVIFVSRWYTNRRKELRRLKKLKKQAALNVGKRSSQRIRLKRHELVFVERISPEEFEQQKGAFTQQQVEALQATKEFKKMKREKGKAIENWNWQTQEAKHGKEDEVSS